MYFEWMTEHFLFGDFIEMLKVDSIILLCEDELFKKLLIVIDFVFVESQSLQFFPVLLIFFEFVEKIFIPDFL